MPNPILSIENLTTVVRKGTSSELQILKGINLDIFPGDFITLLGSNGAGKSTLLNVIAGNLTADTGTIKINAHDVTKQDETTRTKYISRVFQDPKLGTAPRLTVAENLLLAKKRGLKRTFLPRNLKRSLPEFKVLTKTTGNGLDQRLNTPTGDLSGGQRQALSFLMATLNNPTILLLDEHTAALDPKTSDQLMQLTDKTIQDNHLTALMITHRLEDALKYGNRLIALHDGQITLDVRDNEKASLTKADLLNYFATY